MTDHTAVVADALEISYGEAYELVGETNDHVRHLEFHEVGELLATSLHRGYSARQLWDALDAMDLDTAPGQPPTLEDLLISVVQRNG